MAAGGPLPQAFGKVHRLLTAGDFDRVFKQGRRASVPELIIAYRQRPSREGVSYPPRLGLSVSRKVGGAVERNLIKRRLREIFRKNKEKMAFGSEFVVIPRKDATKFSFIELKTRFLDLIERSKLTRKP